MATSFFTCDCCHEDFRTDTDESEAAAELVRNFGTNIPDDEIQILCEDCHERFWEYAAKHYPDLKRVRRENLN